MRVIESVEEGRKLTQRFLEEVMLIPDGYKVMSCIQCGTCSASCPSAYAMDYTPRQIVAALRADIIHEVLVSNSVWLCASCYSCTVRCPAGIPWTDIMYQLKRLGEDEGIIPRVKKGHELATVFNSIIDKYGRSSEFKLMFKFYLRTGLFKALGQLGFASKLIFKGRLGLVSHKIKGISGLQKMMVAMEEGK
ncbi:4Fe-4S dicluster domain-containing protein [bacterium]|nr:4Fe-4S dicluster domain-containing protein [bacterium]